MGKLILVVDDEPLMRTLLKYGLETEGFTVIEAYNGEEALELISERLPELVILDIRMPVLDGIQVFDKLLKDYSIPVILFTGLVDLEPFLKDLPLKESDVVRKPFPMSEMIRRIKDILGE